MTKIVRGGRPPSATQPRFTRHTGPSWVLLFFLQQCVNKNRMQASFFSWVLVVYLIYKIYTSIGLSTTANPGRDWTLWAVPRVIYIYTKVYVHRRSTGYLQTRGKGTALYKPLLTLDTVQELKWPLSYNNLHTNIKREQTLETLTQTTPKITSSQ